MGKSYIQQENGYPTLYVDGKRKMPLLYALSDVPLGEPNRRCAKVNIPLFHDIGIDLVSVCTQIDLDWKENGEYTAEHQIKCIHEIISLNPNAKILFRLNITPPYWWMRKHPEELIKYYNAESVDTGRGPYVIYKDQTNEIKVSFVSQRWYNDVKNVMKQMICILKANGLDKYVFAIQIAYGQYGEWHMFGVGAVKHFVADYSQPMLDFFREYLKEKYKTDAALQQAWGQPSVTLKTAQLATPHEYNNCFNDNGFLYRLPEQHMQALDSWKCFQLSAPKAIATFAEFVKKEWSNVLVGAFYGYFFGCGSVAGRMLEPHLLLNDKNIDFLAGPSAYTANKRAGNAAFLRYMAEAMRLNRKLFLCEMDQGFESYSIYRGDLSKTYTCKDNVEYNAVMARNIFENILRGMGAWYFDHRLPTADMWEKVGYWEDPERIAAVKKVYEFTKLMRERRPVFQSSADVLIVYDTQSVYHLGNSLTGDHTDVHNTYNQFDMADAIAKSGVGYDMIFLDDLQKCDISKYKCVLFVACEAMKKADYAYIKNVVMNDGRTIAFMRRNGYIVDGKSSMENVRALYQADEKVNCKIVIIPEFAYDRRFYRTLFADAGAWVYTQGDEVVCVGNGFIAVHTLGEQDSVICMPKGKVILSDNCCTTAVYDLQTCERVF